jgi:hypothetical protein
MTKFIAFKIFYCSISFQNISVTYPKKQLQKKVKAIMEDS